MKINKRKIYDFLYARDGAVCGICGLSLQNEWKTYQEWCENPKLFKRTKINIDIDHREPKSLRDEHWWINDYSNLQLSHRTCNHAKANKTT